MPWFLDVPLLRKGDAVYIENLTVVLMSFGRLKRAFSDDLLQFYCLGELIVLIIYPIVPALQ